MGIGKYKCDICGCKEKEPVMYLQGTNTKVCNICGEGQLIELESEQQLREDLNAMVINFRDAKMEETEAVIIQIGTEMAFPEVGFSRGKVLFNQRIDI